MKEQQRQIDKAEKFIGLQKFKAQVERGALCVFGFITIGEITASAVDKQVTFGEGLLIVGFIGITSVVAGRISGRDDAKSDYLNILREEPKVHIDKYRQQ